MAALKNSKVSYVLLSAKIFPGHNLSIHLYVTLFIRDGFFFCNENYKAENYKADYILHVIGIIFALFTFQI